MPGDPIARVPSAAETAGLSETTAGHWMECCAAAAHYFEAITRAWHAAPADTLTVPQLGQALEALVGGWEAFARSVGLDPSWAHLPGAAVVKRALDTHRTALAGAGGGGDSVSFGCGLDAAAVATGLRSRLGSCVAWWEKLVG